jgi:hypothetical protein
MSGAICRSHSIHSAAKQVYPFAVSLRESVRTYVQASAKVKLTIAPLVASYKKGVQEHINEGTLWLSDTYT